MKLRYITCSDPREHNSIESIMELARLPLAEIAVQCHPSKMYDGMPRNVWFNKLLAAAKSVPNINLAIHINQEWATDICAIGKIPETILNWIQIQREENQPIIQRIQLNMPKAAADNIDANKLAQIIHDFSNQEFILQYNDNTKTAVEKLHRTGAKFSLLFDASGGKGISPENWQKPVYATHPVGYSGGISPSNVIYNLVLINRLIPKHRSMWIDAEGKLKSPNAVYNKNMFDCELAKMYVHRANLWQK